MEFKPHFPGVASDDARIQTMCFLLMGYDSFVRSPVPVNESKYTRSCSGYDPSGSETVLDHLVIVAYIEDTEDYITRIYPIVTTIP